MSAFTVNKLIRFQHCDPGGVLFAPHYFTLYNEVIEDWWSDGLGVPFRELLVTRRRGTALRRVESEFIAPSIFGDRLEFRLAVQEVGGAFMKLRIEGHCPEKMRCYALMTLVQVDLDTTRVVRWSNEWKAKMFSFREDCVVSE